MKTVFVAQIEGIEKTLSYTLENSDNENIGCILDGVIGIIKPILDYIDGDAALHVEIP